MDLSNDSIREAGDADYAYSLWDIDQVSEELGIPWERSKDKLFACSNTYIGLNWHLDTLT
ncbi:hypothetical protein C0992_003259, partial [Termitomyces sp. T32_za158]